MRHHKIGDNQENQILDPCRFLLLLWPLSLVPRAQAVQNLPCDLFLALLNPCICGRQLEALLAQHDPYSTSHGARGAHLPVVPTSIVRRVEEPRTWMSLCITVLCYFVPARHNASRDKAFGAREELVSSLGRTCVRIGGSRTYRTIRPCKKSMTALASLQARTQALHADMLTSWRMLAMTLIPIPMPVLPRA